MGAVRENEVMARSFLCPVLVSRDDQLAVLEDALLEARRGESRFVVLSGEAGIGKTRLASELAREARDLGSIVLAGSSSEAELSLPYLPIVEAVGNYLDGQDLDALGERLGPARFELAELFPQLGDGREPGRATDPTESRLRLFEAIAWLLAIAAEERGLLLVIEDVHWSDEATREVLDHLARRLIDLPILVLVTYRTEELGRRHPFLPTLQAWRRSGLADVVELEPLSNEGVREMIAAILGSESVDPELSRLLAERAEGNPFVLEEMLREAVEGSSRGEGLETGVAIEPQIPDTVRQAILLRVERLEPEQVEVLEAAAVLGRTFDYPTLLAVSEKGDAAVLSALEAAIGQQLIEEYGDAPGGYSWRHALTQEAIYTEALTPRRQMIHACAAEVLAQKQSTRPVDLVNHLLGAGRFDEAVPVCLEAAEEAEGAAAYVEAISLLQHALPHVGDPVERAKISCRIGKDQWLNGQPALGRDTLSEGIAELERLGEELEAARFRVSLGRCLWECAEAERAREEYERARDVLAAAGPSADLALAYVRLAGSDAFELDYAACMEASRKAIEIAEQAGADFERVWALGFLGLGYLDCGRHGEGFELMDACFEEARAKGYSQIANNVAWNDIWTRTHTLQGGLEERLERMGSLPSRPAAFNEDYIARSYVRKARGELEEARDDAEKGALRHERLGSGKMAWRARVQLAEVLVELGRPAEAEQNLPPRSSRTELQDIVYDAHARIRLHLAGGRIEETAELGREILGEADRLAAYRETLAIGAAALIAAGELDAVDTLIGKAEAHSTAAGRVFIEEMRGRLLFARGDPGAARPHLEAVVEAAAEVGYPLVELRARTLLAEARAGSGDREAAESELGAVFERAAELGARRIADEAGDAAERLGIALPVVEAEPAAATAIEAEEKGDAVPLGERLVTSLFADVRGSTALAASRPPKAVAERMAALYRLARVAVERRQGIVDKFAGDAVMATFNASGARLDHCRDALEAALTLRDKAALVELPVGIGIAVGPAILGKGASDRNVAVRGLATNLAARLQGAAGPSEILLSEEAHRRVEDWLSDRELSATREALDLKGFENPQVAYRLSPPPGEERRRGAEAAAAGR